MARGVEREKGKVQALPEQRDHCQEFGLLLVGAGDGAEIYLGGAPHMNLLDV